MYAVSGSIVMLFVCQLGVTTAGAQEIEHKEDLGKQVLDEVVVAGSRVPANLSTFPGSITVIDAEQIQEQSKITSDLGAILANQVPGLGTASNGSSNFSQTLRGRKPAVLIDGVPATVPLRDGGRDLRVIAPSAIGSIQVIRGASALYGLGGTGGVINYQTRNPGNGAIQGDVRLTYGFSPIEYNDSSSYLAELSATGRAGRVGYVASGYLENIGSLFDSDGDRIPPDPQRQGGIADTRTYDVFGKVLIDLTETQSLQLSVNSFSAEQDTEYSATGGVFGQTKAQAIPVAPGGKGVRTENTVTTLTYAASRVLGGTLSAQMYYSDYVASFPYAPWPVFPDPLDPTNPAAGGGQNQIEAKRTGLRVDLNSPIGDSARVLWGVDYLSDKTSQPLTDGRLWMPEVDHRSWAGFAQFEWDPNDRVTLRGGVRYESAELEVPTFTTIPQTIAQIPRTGVTVQGGTLSYSETVENFGAVFHATKDLDVFIAYSQGFSVADIGRLLRTTTATSVATFEAGAQIVDGYEMGVRGRIGPATYSVTGFYTESDLGAQYDALTFELVRSAEETRGWEATIDANLADRWRVGGTYSRVEGKVDTDSDGNPDTTLNSTRVNPDKLTAYLDYKFSEAWSARIQGLYSFQQSCCGNTVGFGTADMPSVTLIDLLVSGRLGRGTLSLGLSNLLNESYFTPAAWQFATPALFTTGPGMMANATYSIQF